MRPFPDLRSRTALLILLVAAGLATLAPPALAAVRTLNPGRFTTPGVPMYADEPGGGFFLCGLLNRCVTAAERATMDPPAMYWSTSAGAPISDVVCQRGDFYLIETAIIGRGWASALGVKTNEHGDLARGEYNLVAPC